MLEEMSTEDLEDDLLGSDPSRPSLQGLVSGGHPFSIPWSHSVRPLLCSFDSNRMTLQEGPWLPQSPFDEVEARETQLVYDAASISSTYREGMSTNTTSESDHFSIAGGVTIGYSFLNASVSGSYDKHMVKNTNGVQASRNASCRMGRVLLSRTPAFSKHAADVLRGKDGDQKFRDQYGDFFVCGYQLGADAGASLFASTATTKTSETLVLTIAVKVLFVKASKTIRKEKSSLSFSASISFNGYNTLNNTAENYTCAGSAEEQDRLQSSASAYLETIDSLSGDVAREIERLGLKDGEERPFARCVELCRSGLVVELVLAPYARLPRYLEIIAEE